MNVPFSTAALLAVVLVAVGGPLALAVGRSRSWVAATLVPAGGLGCSAAVAACVVTRTSMVPWLVGIAVLGWVAVALGRRRGPKIPPLAGLDAPGPKVLLVAAAVAVAPVLLVDLPAIISDARYIWWFHAAWFREGGDVTREGMANPVFGGSHSGYPPFVPGTIAAVWHLHGAYDREVALRVSQLVAAAAVVATSFFVTATLRLGRRGAMVAAGLVAAVCWGANANVGLSGLVDMTWAAFLVPAAVLLLAGSTDKRTIRVGALLLTAAAMIKFEAQAASMILVALTFVRAGRAWRRALPVAVAVGGAVGTWLLVTNLAHVPVDDRGDWLRLADVFRTDSEVHARIAETLPFLARQLGPLVWLSVLTVVALVVLGRLAGTPLRQPGLLLLLVVPAAYTLFLTAAFSVAILPLDEYLVFGAYRTLIVVRLLVLMDVALACVAAARALGLFAADPPDGGPVDLDPPSERATTVAAPSEATGRDRRHQPVG